MNKAIRPKTCSGTTRKIRTGCGSMYVTITEVNGKMFEVFGKLGKSGGCAKGQIEAMTRCITTGLRYGVPPEEYIKQLRNITCPSPLLTEGVTIESCPDAISFAMREFLKGDNGENNSKEACKSVKAA